MHFKARDDPEPRIEWPPLLAQMSAAVERQGVESGWNESRRQARVILGGLSVDWGNPTSECASDVHCAVFSPTEGAAAGKAGPCKVGLKVPRVHVSDAYDPGRFLRALKDSRGVAPSVAPQWGPALLHDTGAHHE